ncbi:MAG: helix-turn-helix transcriptional regulator, partial [Selenomonadaceae bacterium]|nr:helix-turn-helix transcriptional regulator [Selenomonadaceae bacterium]
MYKKDTEELLAEIKNDADMEKFLSKNRKEFKKPLHEYLSQIVEEKGLNKKDIVKNSNLNPNYVYHILSGERTNPSRPKLIAIAMAMNLNFDEIQYLLRYVGFSPLYPRNPWDTIVISAVNKGLSVLETD